MVPFRLAPISVSYPFATSTRLKVMSTFEQAAAPAGRSGPKAESSRPERPVSWSRLTFMQLVFGARELLLQPAD